MACLLGLQVLHACSQWRLFRSEWGKRRDFGQWWSAEEKGQERSNGSRLHLKCHDSIRGIGSGCEKASAGAGDCRSKCSLTTLSETEIASLGCGFDSFESQCVLKSNSRLISLYQQRENPKTDFYSQSLFVHFFLYIKCQIWKIMKHFDISCPDSYINKKEDNKKIKKATKEIPSWCREHRLTMSHSREWTSLPSLTWESGRPDTAVALTAGTQTTFSLLPLLVTHQITLRSPLPSSFPSSSSSFSASPSYPVFGRSLHQPHLHLLHVDAPSPHLPARWLCRGNKMFLFNHGHMYVRGEY